MRYRHLLDGFYNCKSNVIINEPPSSPHCQSSIEHIFAVNSVDSGNGIWIEYDMVHCLLGRHHSRYNLFDYYSSSSLANIVDICIVWSKCSSRTKPTFSATVGKGRKLGERWNNNNVLPGKEIVLANLEETGSVGSILKRMSICIITQNIHLCLNFATIPRINQTDGVSHPKPSLVNRRTRKHQTRHRISRRIYSRDTNSKWKGMGPNRKRNMVCPDRNIKSRVCISVCPQLGFNTDPRKLICRANIKSHC